MGKLFKRARATIILTGVALIVLGVIIFLYPIAATSSLVEVVGWTLVVAGVITLVTSFVRRNPETEVVADLTVALAEIVPGIIMVMAPTVFVLFIWSLIGLYIILTGINDVFEALDLRGVADHHWGARLAMGVLTILLGAFVVATPVFSTAVGMLLCACALVVDGVSEVASGVRLKDPDAGQPDDL